MARFNIHEQQAAIQHLRETLNPGDHLYTVLRSVSRSGMSRVIDVYVIQDNQPIYLSGWIASALGWTRTDSGIRVSGCGMDAGFHLIHQLSYALFPDSFICIGQGCPSNDHNNGDRDYTPHQHSDGGYALTQRWI